MIYRKADINDKDGLIRIFDDYRAFYGMEKDPDAVIAFLHDRLTKNDSHVIVAELNGKIIGFTQLYPTFSSVSLKDDIILNDLYVDAEHRGKGIGKELLERAKAYCQEKNIKGMMLETATDNPAQFLYEKSDFVKMTDVFHYYWKRES